MEKIDFTYQNTLFTFAGVWIVGGIVLYSIFSIFISEESLMWIIDKFNNIGFFITIAIVIILYLTVFIGSYITSIIITDKNGTAIFYEDYVEIKFGEKIIKINYIKIKSIDFCQLPKWIRVNRKLTVYKFNLQTTDKIIIEFKSSYKEMWKNYGMYNKSTLRELYEQIEMYMANKMEKEYE